MTLRTMENSRKTTYLITNDLTEHDVILRRFKQLSSISFGGQLIPLIFPLRNYAAGYVPIKKVIFQSISTLSVWCIERGFFFF